MTLNNLKKDTKMKKEEKVQSLKDCFNLMDSEIQKKLIDHNCKASESFKLVNLLAKSGLIMSSIAVVSTIALIVNSMFFSGKMFSLLAFTSSSSMLLMIFCISKSFSIYEKFEEAKLNSKRIFDFTDEDEYFEAEEKNNLFLKGIILPKEVYFSIYQKIKDLIGEDEFKLNIEHVAASTEMDDIGNAYFVKMVIWESVDFIEDEDDEFDSEWEALINKAKEKSLNNLYASLK